MMLPFLARSLLIGAVTITTSAAALLSQTFGPRVNEVLIDPVGPNAGRQQIEVFNFDNRPADLTGWTLATTNGTAALPAVTLPAFGVARIHLGASGTSSPTDIFLPSATPLATIDCIALFRSAVTNNPQDLADYVSWNGANAYIGLAVQALQWPSAQDTVSLALQEGCTLGHYDEMAYGNQSRPESWFADCTPTLGTPNDAGGIFAYGYGCPNLSTPLIGSGAEDNRPWIGEPWKLTVYNLPAVPTTILVAMGFSGLNTLPLDPFGIPGCFFEVDPLAVLARAMPAASGEIFLNLPNDPGFVGLAIRIQGLVPVTGANVANALPTREIRGFVGSR